MRQVLVRVLKSYDNYRSGDLVWILLTESVAHLIASSYLQLVDDPAWRG